ncbi:MAG TPA: decarboxylating NADP(+)-dependent phosphogluconate dehydrogenase [Acidimicrobiia bacterium]|nr:decarboxylating NADP(+)-dependent phosphogluconate dehydrogenase [Acidimicrobiia bacterium]
MTPPGQKEADIAVVGLAVMGQNLALNLADHGYAVAVYNRTAPVTERFVGENPHSHLRAATELRDLVAGLARPRRFLLMVKAGAAVDQTLDSLLALLEPGDIVIDGGNSFWRDTERRLRLAGARGVHLIGAGISGGEAGARHGPSIMPGGAAEAWPHVKAMLQAIAAQAPDGRPCCDWIGPQGSGHFVKMVHNGIEYCDMQVIAEAYHLMRASGRSNPESAAAFRRWHQTRLDSYLIQITAEILQREDTDGLPLIDRILDSAGQKGTGRWAVESALELGQPVTLLAEAVFARIVSALKEQRSEAAALLPGPDTQLVVEETDITDALYGSKVVSYAQGFTLMQAASQEEGWGLDLAAIAPLWRAGCIIRAALLDSITEAFRQRPDLSSLLVDREFSNEMAGVLPGWRRVVSAAAIAGIPVPAYAGGLAFYDSYRAGWLPANLIQAQRDYFGAHTYERTDRPRGEFFHTEW